MEVVLVRWPAERGRREELTELGVARLLLVDEGHGPPEPADCLEDWIRVPASEADVQLRIAGLATRSSAHGSSEELPPRLDDDGVLRAGGGWVPVPPVEARLLRTLLDRYGAVVSRDSLSRAGWADRAPDRNVLDVHVLRLRRRIAPVGLVIRTVRSRGYLLESDKSQQSVRNAQMELRPAERSVLEVLIAAEGRVVSREHLARRAGLRDVSPRRVDSLLSSLRRELGDDVLRTVRGRGWLLTKPIEL